MVECKLTDYGREQINDWVDSTARRGGWVTLIPPRWRDAGLAPVGEGDARFVVEEADDAPQPIFQGGDCVVKVSRSNDPWQSVNEIVNWTYAPPEVREVLFPVREVADDAMWLAMPKAEGLDVTVEPSVVLDRLHEAGYTIVDVRADHIGLHNGVPKLVDHGHRIESLDGERLGPRAVDGAPEAVEAFREQK